MLPQNSRNSSEKKFQSYESVQVVAPGGSGGRQTGCVIEPAAVVNPSPVEMSAIRPPSVGIVEPSPPTTRPLPRTLKPGTLPANPLPASKPPLRTSPWLTTVSAPPRMVRTDGGDPPSVRPGVSAWLLVFPARRFVNTSSQALT